MIRKWIEGSGHVDQRAALADTKVLTAVVNGADEQFVDLDYIDAGKYGNLWREKCIRIKDSQHAPFWDQQDQFLSLFLEFLQDALG